MGSPGAYSYKLFIFNPVVKYLRLGETANHL